MEIELSVNMIVLVARWSRKGHFLVALGKTWLICWGLVEAELQAFFPGGRAFISYIVFVHDSVEKAISQCHRVRLSSFVQVLGRQNFKPFSWETELWAIISGDWVLGHSPRRQSFKLFSQEIELWVDMIVLVARWSWKGHFSVTLGKTWLIYTGLRETELWVNTIVLVARWCWKGHFMVTVGKMWLFLSGLRETEFQAIFLGDRASSHSPRRWNFKLFSKEMQLQVNTIVLVARWSWKGHFSVTLGKTQLICWGIAETEFQATLMGSRSLSHFARRQSFDLIW